MKPEVRIIEPQQEEIKPATISQNEKEMLLFKYGYKNEYVEPSAPQSAPKNNYTFEELCKMEEDKINNENLRRKQKAMGAKPTSFDGGYDSETHYGTDSDSGFTFKVTIVSDMPIPKNY